MEPVKHHRKSRSLDPTFGSPGHHSSGDTRQAIFWGIRHSFIKIEMKLSLLIKNTFINNHFHQKPHSSKHHIHPHHFHPNPISSKTIFIKIQFHPKPFSSKNSFIKKQFHPKPFSSKTPLSSNNSKPQTQNPKLQTPNPKPQTPNAKP